MSNLRDFLGGLDPAVWTDAKAGYLDANVSSRAPSSTALSTATWTSTRAGKLDNVDTTVSSRAPSSTALSTATWTSTKAGYLDSNISSRAPSSTALSTNTWTSTRAGYLDTSISSRVSANVWTTTYRNRIDTNISSRLGTCSTQRLDTRSTQSDANYATWTISSVNVNQSFLTVSSSGAGSNGLTYPTGYSARFINGTNVRYVQGTYYNYQYSYGTPSVWNPWSGLDHHYFSVHAVRIY